MLPTPSFSFNFFYLLLLPLFIGCNTKTIFHEVKETDHFAVKIADYLHKKNDTLLTNSFLYEDSIRGIIFIVIKESKDSMRNYNLNYTIDNYFLKTTKSLTTKLKQGHVANYYPVLIDSNKAMIADIKGTNEDEKLYYKLGIIETSKNFYQLIYSVLDENAGGLKKDMETSIKSFREL